MSSETCRSSSIVDLPDDIIAIIGRSLSPSDICNLSQCGRSLNSLAASDKLWYVQCEMVGVVCSEDLIEWRKAVLSYKALCKFLTRVKPLLGIWVQQNPELGNAVYVMPGFVSVVGCRIIPQEVGPLGIEDHPVRWAPVFEVIGDHNGSTKFILHGRDKDHDYICLGSVKSVEKSCNVLLLEVETRKEKTRGQLEHCRSLSYHSDQETDGKISERDSRVLELERFDEQIALTAPFRELSFEDQKKLLKIVTSQVRVEVPHSGYRPLFHCSRGDEDNFNKDMMLISERRSMLIKMHDLGGGHIDWTTLPYSTKQMDPTEIRKTLGDYVKDSSADDDCRTVSDSSSNKEKNHAQLHDFLSSGDTVGLTLNASTKQLSSYKAWPIMHIPFALYKFPVWEPVVGQEYAGLWGGTFGWPPRKPNKDKSGKALFLLVLSYYEKSPGQNDLIATKILEGTGYAQRPNGSAMFTVNVCKPSIDPFPWDFSVKKAFSGMGIASGYGFRYPGEKPGSLFVLQDGMLAFLWKESRSVLTLQRLEMESLLKKGERVPALPPIPNFSYLTRSYTNVFCGD